MTSLVQCISCDPAPLAMFYRDDPPATSYDQSSLWMPTGPAPW